MTGKGLGTLLVRIKRLIIHRAYRFTAKAAAEIDLDALTEEDIVESILNAERVRSKRSTSVERARLREKVHIIEGYTYDGILVYTKGVIRREHGQDVFYVLISAKRSHQGGNL